MWLQQRFPQGQDQHREGSDLLLLLGFGVSQSEPLLFVHGPAAGAERGTLIAELGFCLPLPPLAPLLPKFLPQVPAGRGSQPPESPTALPSVLHLTQGINRWLCPSQPPAPGRMRLGKDFFLKKTTSGHSPGRSQRERS